jgi:hypothetical protein
MGRIERKFDPKVFHGYFRWDLRGIKGPDDDRTGISLRLVSRLVSEGRNSVDLVVISINRPHQLTQVSLCPGMVKGWGGKVGHQAPGRAWGINFELKSGNLSRHGHFEREVARWLPLTKWRCRRTNPVALERTFEQSVWTRGQVLIVRSSRLENRRDRMNVRVRKILRKPTLCSRQKWTLVRTQKNPPDFAFIWRKSLERIPRLTLCKWNIYGLAQRHK